MRALIACVEATKIHKLLRSTYLNFPPKADARTLDGELHGVLHTSDLQVSWFFEVDSEKVHPVVGASSFIVMFNASKVRYSTAAPDSNKRLPRILLGRELAVTLVSCIKASCLAGPFCQPP